MACIFLRANHCNSTQNLTRKGYKKGRKNRPNSEALQSEMDLKTWIGLSFLACCLLLYQAFLSCSSPTFYSFGIQATATSVSIAIWLNLFGCLFLMLNKSLFGFVFGRLRGVEVERLYEKIWYSVTETLLALTIFRDDFGIGFVILFAVLITLKSWHWIMADRIDVMEHEDVGMGMANDNDGPSSTWWHVRILTTFLVLGCLDVAGFTHHLHTIGIKGASIVFGFEYMILITQFLAIFIKYSIHSLDRWFAGSAPGGNGGWEDKALYIMFTDLVSDFLRLFTYIGFFFTVLHFYGLPLHIIRDVYVTVQSFIQRIADVRRYLKAVEEMKTKFPDATWTDVDATDGICIICREELGEGLPDRAAIEGGAVIDNSKNPIRPKKLHCGHIFHFRCLKSWLERQQSCPTCRKSVLETPPPTPQLGGVPAAPPAVPQPNVPPVAHAPLQQPFMPLHQQPGWNVPPPYHVGVEAALGNGFAQNYVPIFTPQPNFIMLTPLIPAALNPGIQLTGMSDSELEDMLRKNSIGNSGFSATALQAQVDALHSVQGQLSQLSHTLTRLLTVVEKMEMSNQPQRQSHEAV